MVEQQTQTAEPTNDQIGQKEVSIPKTQTQGARKTEVYVPEIQAQGIE